jgi:hypothetical protein
MNDMDLFGTETAVKAAPVKAVQLGLFATEKYIRPKPLDVIVRPPTFDDQLDLFSDLR